MNNNCVTAATITINKELANGQTIAFAKVKLSYKKGAPPLVDQDVARAHCDRLFKQILLGKGVFKHQIGGSLSLSPESGLHGDVFFCEEHSQLVDTMPDVIGDLWCNVITKGTGSYRKVDVEPLPSIPLEERMSKARVVAIKGD